MASSTGARFVGNMLRLSALGCGATGLLLVPVYPILGVALCVVAVADLGLVWLLNSVSPGVQAETGQEV